MKSVLLLHATVGTGHKSAAEAVGSAFSKYYPDIDVGIEDIFDYGSPVFKGLYADSYIELSEKAPELWAYWYRSNKDENRLLKDFRIFVGKLGIYQINKLKERYNPEAIICTHFLPVEILIEYKKNKKLNIPIYCVVTDYTGHIFWVHQEVDMYFVGNNKTKAMLVKKGVQEENITVTGIPVHSKFNQEYDIDTIRTEWNISQSPVITVMCGGLQTYTVKKIVQDLSRKIKKGTIVVLAGRNKDIQKQLYDIPREITFDLRVLGHIDYIEKIIAASDLIVTKAGGLIVSEIQAVGTPMILIDPIPGQEEWNADYITSIGSGIQMRLPEMVGDLVENLLQFSERIGNMKLYAKKLGRPYASKDIADIVVKGSE